MHRRLPKRRLKKKKMQASVWEPIFCIPLLCTQRRDVKYCPKTHNMKDATSEERTVAARHSRTFTRLRIHKLRIKFHKLRIITFDFCLTVLLGISPGIRGLIPIKSAQGTENTHTHQFYPD